MIPHISIRNRTNKPQKPRATTELGSPLQAPTSTTADIPDTTSAPTNPSPNPSFDLLPTRLTKCRKFYATCKHECYYYPSSHITARKQSQANPDNFRKNTS